jgi:hypothetical protein
MFLSKIKAQVHLNGTHLVKRNTLALNLAFLLKKSCQPFILSPRHSRDPISLIEGLRCEQNKIL